MAPPLRTPAGPPTHGRRRRPSLERHQDPRLHVGHGRPGGHPGARRHGATVVRVESEHKLDVARGVQPFVANTPGIENGGLSSTTTPASSAWRSTWRTPPPATSSRPGPLGRRGLRVVLTRAMRSWGFGYDDRRRGQPRPDHDVVDASWARPGRCATSPGSATWPPRSPASTPSPGGPTAAPAGPYSAYTDYVAPRITVAVAARRARRPRPHRRGPVPRLLPGRGVDPPPRAGAARPHGRTPTHPTRRQRRSVGRAERRVPLRRRRRVGPPSPARPTSSAPLVRCHRRPDGPRTSRRGRRPARRPRWRRALQAVGVPVHGVQNNAACYADAQLQHRGQLRLPAAPGARHVHHRGPAPTHVAHPPFVRRANPTMGEHNELVLGRSSATTRNGSPNW